MPPQFFDLSPLESYIEQGYTVLTPNQRLARAIQGAWDARQLSHGRLVWEPLSASSIDAWLHERWQEAVRGALAPSRLVLSKQQESLLWQAIISNSEEEGAELIHPGAAADHAAQARERLLMWQVPMTRADTAQRFDSERDCRAFHGWLRMFEEQLERETWATRADCLAALAAIHAASRHKVVLVASAELAPLERACLDVLCDVVDILPTPAPQGSAYVYPFPEQRQELAAVAAWAARIHREQPEATAAIVLADTGEQRIALDYLLRREFDCLGQDYYSLPVNFSTGIGLSRVPVVRDALTVLATVLDRIRVDQVVDLMHSRFLQVPDAGSAMAVAFIQQLYRRGSEQLDVGALRTLANRVQLDDEEGLVLGQYLLAVSGMRELRQKALPSQWVERFNQVLDTWGWPGSGDLDSLEYQQLTRWYQTLDGLHALDMVTGTVDYAEALRLLRLSCDQQVSHPQTAQSRIQVLGPLEAVGLNVDYLWVCGVQGGTWPSPPRPNPFIPLSIQATMAMPHATPEREWQFSETLVQQYRGACGALYASYSRQVNGAPELPSGLIETFEEAKAAGGELLDPHWLTERAGSSSELLLEISAPAPDDAELAAVRGGSSIIEHQSQCPFRSFAAHRLEAEPLAAFTLGVSASERGKIVHEALQFLWSQIDSHAALAGLQESPRDALVRAAAETGVGSLRTYRRQELGRACLELEQQRLEQLLQQWLDIEIERGEFAVKLLEEPVRLSLSRLQISLRVDRIDQLPDGRSVIVDYKTGTAAIKDWLGERPAKPQLLLYGLAADELPAALSFAQVRPDDCAYVGIGDTQAIPGVKSDLSKLYRDAPVYEDWEALNRHWQSTLQALAQSFLDGRAEVDPLPDSCTWCGLQDLCRINDTREEQGEDRA